MHERLRVDNLAAERLPDALMAKAHAKYRHSLRVGLDE